MDEKVTGASFEGDPPAAAEPEALPDRRELALVALERTRMPMVITDPRQHDNPIVLANEAFLSLTGYSAEEVLGRNCRFLQGPDTDPASVDTIRRELAAGTENFEVELLNYRKDGSTFWNQLHISPITDETGELLYYFTSHKDMTARRRAGHLEVAERLLLMEVDHRAMNALALVQSIVSLSRTDNADQYARSIRGRVAALARAHRLLAASGWTGASLRDLVEEEIPERMRERVALRGPDLELPPQLVQPFSLILHELMSNALRHGALSEPNGIVEMTWAREDGRLVVRWQETEGKILTAVPESGAGMRMIEGVVGRQLLGQVEASWDAPGFRIEMTIPGA